jgi:nitrogen fixation protein NifU and related proteins
MINTVGTFEGVEIDQMYREHILDHYKNQRNAGKLDNSISFHDTNPLCGDEITMYAQFEQNVLKAIKFQASGCAISQASASILTEAAINRPIEHIKQLNRESMQELIGITVSPARVKCMMLPVKALKTLAYQHEGKRLEEQTAWN